MEELKDDAALEHMTRHERRMLKHATKEEQKTQQLEKIKSEKKAKSIKKFSIIGVILVLIVGGISFIAYSYSNSPGPYDKFAKCLSQKGAVMYGATWCQFTAEQKAMFGKSFKYIDYKDFSAGPDISVTPTWVIDGKKYEKAQSFERLSSLTGCEVV